MRRRMLFQTFIRFFLLKQNEPLRCHSPPSVSFKLPEISLSVWTRWETTTLPLVNSPISPVSDAIGPLASKTLRTPPLIRLTTTYLPFPFSSHSFPFLEMIKLQSRNQIVSGVSFETLMGLGLSGTRSSHA